MRAEDQPSNYVAHDPAWHAEILTIVIERGSMEREDAAEILVWRAYYSCFTIFS